MHDGPVKVEQRTATHNAPHARKGAGNRTRACGSKQRAAERSDSTRTNAELCEARTKGALTRAARKRILVDAAHKPRERLNRPLSFVRRQRKARVRGRLAGNVREHRAQKLEGGNERGVSSEIRGAVYVQSSPDRHLLAPASR